MSQPKERPRRHGRTRHYIESEGWVTTPLCSPEALMACSPGARTAAAESAAPTLDPLAPPEPAQPGAEEPPPPTRFCRLLPKGRQASEEGLIELGLAMESEVHGVGTQGESDIPAGYTYLGQFVDHDITAQDQGLDLGSSPVNPGDVPSRRTPSLDLDSLYGRGPKDSPILYEADGIRFRVGLTSPTAIGEPGGPIPGGFRNDLPRDGTKALIGDDRNDENLAVAQTHLAFLKFHNRTADRLQAEDATLRGADLFEAARRAVTLAYQSIILNDYLPRVIETDVLQETVASGPRLYDGTKGDCMPVEFAAAAFRLGHSMVRPSYEWNRVFNSGSIPATFALLFEFSGLSGTRGGPNDPPFNGKPTLPSNWIVDWTRMYDFGGRLGGQTNDFQRARKLDVQLAMDLRLLPEFQQMGEGVPRPLLSLATRNLLRGRQLSLPSGQAAAQALKDSGFHFKEVPSKLIANGSHRAILEKHGFVQHTPLWYYILREAKVRHDGQRLGPVGSRLVAEFFVGAIQRSTISVLKTPDVQPFSMPELLRAVGDLNPIGLQALS